MHRLIITDPAKQHLKKIAKYTLDRHGADQAEKYETELIIGLHHLLDNPFIGVDVGDIRANLRKWRIEEHTVYYKVSDNNVVVFGVLHPSQNAEDHL